MSGLASCWEEYKALYGAEREAESDRRRICDALFGKGENGCAFLQNLSRLLQAGAKIEKIEMLPYGCLSQIVLKKEGQDEDVKGVEEMTKVLKEMIVGDPIPTTTIHHFSFPTNYPIQIKQVAELQANHQKVAIHFNGVMYRSDWELTTDQRLKSLMTKSNLDQFSKLSLAQISKICPVDKLCESIYNYLFT